VSDKFRVVIADFISDDLEPERMVLEGLARVDALDAHSEQELHGRIDDADAIMLFHNVAITAATIERLEKCRLISRCGVGFDNVDRQAARQRNIPVANVPDYGTEEVADTAIAMLLTLTRGVTRLDLELRRSPQPWMYTRAAPLFRLRGLTLGIVGLGRIGKATALRAKALGMDVAFYDPLIEDGVDKALGVRRLESLQQLLEQSYAVSLHCPRNEQTERMINAQSIAWMRPGSYLINTARGALIDTTALLPALQHGHLAAVALDVLPTEPPRSDDPLVQAWRNPDHPLYSRIVINPHSAFYCQEGLTEMRVKAAENCRRALLGHPIRNIVN
jgi:D-3-phosphoglycerate dehydrogenase/C-terminal binding protein